MVDGQSIKAEGDKGRFEVLRSRLGSAASKELSLPICVTCSTQTSYEGPDLDTKVDDSAYKCKICLDPRQYVSSKGQKWTTLQHLIQGGNGSFYNDFEEVVPGSLWTFKTRPSFGIGQRAFLIKEPKVKGLIMWDCVAYLDDATLEEIDRISGGEGISHMTVSHPHYYSTTATWTAAFPHMRLWLAEADFDEWYQRRDVVQDYKKGQTVNKRNRISLINQEQTSIDADSSVKILLLGGHFPGSLVLHWNDSLFIADTIQVIPSGLYRSDQPQRPNVASVSFLWSYPNQIPLSASEVQRVCAPLEKVSFTKAFGAFEGFDIWGRAKEKIFQSRDIICKRLAAP